MTRVFKFDARSQATLNVDNVDDGAGIFVDDVKKVQVDMGKSGSLKLGMVKGLAHQVRFELWNVTGGSYHGLFRISGKVNGKETEVYYYGPMGESGPTAVAWQESFSLECL
jgi:hypothetical protein